MLPSPMKAFRRSTPKERSPDELHLAVLTGRTKRIKHLLRKGVHIESVNSHGQTPLFCASFGGDVEVVQLLLRLGSNPNRRCGINGATPVHGAAYRGSRRVLRLLAEAGGELTLNDNLEQTPRDYALKQPSPIRRQKILQFLEILLATMTLHHGLPGHHSTLVAHPAKSNTLSLKRESSIASVWGACLNESANSTLKHNSKPITTQPPPNLHKSVSCHVLDQMYVSTSLPLLSPADLKRPDTTQQAYTCGGPTVYSPHTWLGTNVTVRRPTPALSLPKENIPKGEDQSGPDEGAVKSLVSELAVLRRLRHPGFLEVMAACHITAPQPDHITLVFQHIPLGTLYHHLHVQHLDLSIGAAVDILLGLVEALLFLHAHGWYHAGLSAHSLHLATNRHAKLGNFEFAIEFHGKESSMKVPELLRAAWLQPWQAPETLMEQMVSTRTEIYAFAAILWEIWSGMPPWSGLEEDEITRRVGAGDTLPPVGGTAPSLVTYLTEYGLKWNAHERELDLQEIHTMLRSLRLQADEEERVPAVQSWGPPSIPNTPVIGRHSNQNANVGQQSKRNSVHVMQENIKGSKKSDILNRKNSLSPENLFRNLEEKVANENSKSKKSKKSSQHKDVNANQVVKGGIQSSTLKAQVHKPQEVRKQSDMVQQSVSRPLSMDVRDGAAAGVISSGNCLIGKMEKALSGDSGFSTPCTRTPSPTNDTITSAKINPVMLTSTPVKPSISSVLRVDMQPDLLPNKVNVKNFSHGHTPDILAQSPIIDTGRGQRRATMASLMPPVDTESDLETSRTSSPSDDNESIYDYITNPAKRAFFSESEGGSQELVPFTPERPSSASKLEKKSLRSRASSALRQYEVVRRGLSLTNISSFTSTTSVTRTTSHVSLISNNSSSSATSDPGSRRPRRTVSQISITLKKLTHVSDSSSSKDELSEPQPEQQQRSRRSRSVPKSPPYSSYSSGSESKRSWEENKAIKPASHQLTRHSSSCSLASNPASPTHKHQQQSWLAHNSTASKPQNVREGSQTLQHTNKNKQVPVSRRWNSVSGTAGSPLGDAAAVKITPRRHSEGVRPRSRRNRRRQEVEIEEEFFDDEFNATLFQQPHMQLSVGSSENLLDNSVATHSMLADGTVSPVNLGLSFSPGLTSSEDEEDEATTRERRLKAVISACSTRCLGALLEDADSQEDDGKHSLDKDIAKACQEISEKFNDTGNMSDSDDLSGPWSVESLKKDYEPLKSVELLRNLEKNLNTYLPTYSIASDTESSGP